jgi:hypothetical protein
MNEDEMSTAQSTALSLALRAQERLPTSDQLDAFYDVAKIAVIAGEPLIRIPALELLSTKDVGHFVEVSFVIARMKEALAEWLDGPRGQSASEQSSNCEAVTNNSEPSP